MDAFAQINLQLHRQLQAGTFAEFNAARAVLQVQPTKSGMH